MIVILKQNPDLQKMNLLLNRIRAQNITVQISETPSGIVLGLIGDTSQLDTQALQQQAIVERIERIREPYKAANRKLHPLNTIITVNDKQIGSGGFTVIAGPCSVESEEQIIGIAESVKNAGADMLRGGAFKPRTSPYSFQGLREEGIRLLLKAKEATGLPIVTELMDLSQLDLFQDVDIIQIGARNMQNFEMLRQIGHCTKPILLKRGFANTYQELLMSAEYILSSGNPNVILCERGIRTFESYTRNTFDVAASPALKTMSHLPVFMDPSHACGNAKFVPQLALASAAVGADGLLIEVHNDPVHALCDGAQSITPECFTDIMNKIRGILPYRFQEVNHE